MAKSSAKEQMQQLAANLQQAAAANNSAPFKDLVASGRELDVLFYAAEFGGTDIVRAILAAGADANKGESHLKPLAIAAEHGQTEVARLLMDAGADVNDVGLLGPPICEAVGNGHVEIVRLLLEHGADPHVKYMGTTLLCVAAGRGRSAVVPLLLKAGLDPNQTDGSNRARTPIMWAAEVGDVQIIRELLAAGSRVDPPPRAGPPKDKMEEVYLEKGSALTIAARHGRAEAVAELLKAGADPKFVDGEGRTAYDWARKSQNAQMLKALIDAGAAPIGGATLGDLVAAAEAGDCEGIRAALKAGIGVDEKDKATYDSSSVVCGGLSALMLAARGGHVDAVKLLLERGANVNALSDDIAHGARPALIYAVAAGQAATVKQLLDAGADLAIAGKAFDGSTGTALHAAARKGDAEMVKLLIAAGAQPADKSGGKPPLHLAAARDHLDVISALLGAKAKIDQKDREGETALHTAAGKGKLAAVKLLIARGAKVNITDRSGATPLYASPTNLSLRETSIDAKGNKNVKDPDDPIGVMKALLAAGADPSIATERHGTVLAHSVSHPQAVQLLLEHKADPNITDAEGNSPLLMAIYYSNSESVRLLLEAGAKANIVNEKGVTPLDVALDRKMTKIAEMIEKA
ncbi:MAG TPA: ankyrin repeat domain-containing protein, partial [Tepidisphaeraceae bacterium]|nr:ankyrin repeat domain-containing protein [Tepidisphaeraceae bacterium]